MIARSVLQKAHVDNEDDIVGTDLGTIRSAFVLLLMMLGEAAIVAVVVGVGLVACMIGRDLVGESIGVVVVSEDDDEGVFVVVVVDDILLRSSITVPVCCIDASCTRRRRPSR